VKSGRQGRLRNPSPDYRWSWGGVRVAIPGFPSRINEIAWKQKSESYAEQVNYFEKLLTTAVIGLQEFVDWFEYAEYNDWEEF